MSERAGSAPYVHSSASQPSGHGSNTHSTGPGVPAAPDTSPAASTLSTAPQDSGSASNNQYTNAGPYGEEASAPSFPPLPYSGVWSPSAIGASKRGSDADWTQGHHDPKSLKSDESSVAPQVVQRISSDEQSSSGGRGVFQSIMSKFRVPIFSVPPSASPVRAAIHREPSFSGIVEGIRGPNVSGSSRGKGVATLSRQNSTSSAVSAESSQLAVANDSRPRASRTSSRQGSLSSVGTQRTVRQLSILEHSDDTHRATSLLPRIDEGDIMLTMPQSRVAPHPAAAAGSTQQDVAHPRIPENASFNFGAPLNRTGALYASQPVNARAVATGSAPVSVLPRIDEGAITPSHLIVAPHPTTVASSTQQNTTHPRISEDAAFNFGAPFTPTGASIASQSVNATDIATGFVPVSANVDPPHPAQNAPSGFLGDLIPPLTFAPFPAHMVQNNYSGPNDNATTSQNVSPQTAELIKILTDSNSQPPDINDDWSGDVEMPVDTTLPPFTAILDGNDAGDENNTRSSSDGLSNHTRKKASTSRVSAPRKRRGVSKKGKENETQPSPSADHEQTENAIASAFTIASPPTWPNFAHPGNAIPSAPQAGPSFTGQHNPWQNPPLPANIESNGEYGPLLTFMSNRLDQMSSFIHQSQAHQATMTQTYGAVQQMLEATAKLQCTILASSGENRNTTFHPMAPRETRTRRAFVPRDDSDTTSADASKSLTKEECKEYDNFLACIRRHTLILLKIKDLKYICNTPCVLSEEEHDAFDQELPGSIVISSTNFRVDLSRDRNTPFNLEACSVFAKDFYDKVVNDQWYSRPAIPERYRDVDTIELAFYNHLRYIKERYTQMRAPKGVNEKRLQKSSRGTRKRRLYKDRLEAVTQSDSLSKHASLLEAVRAQGMSSDESDREDGEDGKKAKSNSFSRVYPAWRSSQLAGFLWHLDNVVAANRAPLVGTRKRPGAAARLRPHSQKINKDAPAPPGLPRNCYERDWLASVERLFPRQFKALNIQQFDYAFDGFEDSLPTSQGISGAQSSPMELLMDIEDTGSLQPAIIGILSASASTSAPQVPMDGVDTGSLQPSISGGLSAPAATAPSVVNTQVNAIQNVLEGRTSNTAGTSPEAVTVLATVQTRSQGAPENVGT
ncbi:hypothetical protein BV22DRAFT_1051388 [Leucogyrophana mollusca]|uniref:Uncharacterized protein n=1 Tax=Leucogyrophana mollusca TaxID=85980 RepID=A0ACB8AZX2_9AGAM|nr:hypothetical protein BV22DRAFT_1051388 [Leucogyrophana mollusca]